MSIKKEKNVDVVIVTYKPAEDIKIAISRLSRQSVKVDNIYIINMVDNEIDSEIQNFSYESGKIFYNGVVSDMNDIINFEDKYDGTKIHIRYMRKDSIYLRGTKKLVSTISDADYILYMAQDVMPTSKHLIKKMLEGFNDSNVACVYSRQYAKKKSGYIEKKSYNNVFAKNGKNTNMETAFFGYNDCCMYKKEVFDKLKSDMFLLEAYSMKKEMEGKGYSTARIYDVGVRKYKCKDISYFLQKVVSFSMASKKDFDYLGTDFVDIKNKSTILIMKYCVYKVVECVARVIGKMMRVLPLGMKKRILNCFCKCGI